MLKIFQGKLSLEVQSETKGCYQIPNFSIQYLTINSYLAVVKLSDPFLKSANPNFHHNQNLVQRASTKKMNKTFSIPP